MGPRRPAAAPIRFGTSGWRGILGDEISEPRAAAAVTGVADWLAEQGGRGPVLVAHDRRFGGERLARLAARVLVARGFEARRARGAVPTPAVARAVLREGARAALVFTASHNEPSDHGLKVLDAAGGSVPSRASARIETFAAAALAAGRGAQAPAGAARCDLVTPYLRDLEALLDGRALARAGLAVAYDAMHGAGAGVLDEALRRAGVRVAVRRGERDLRFGGLAPDPLPERLVELRRAVARDRRVLLGLATDGDADRFAAIDADGRPLSAADGVALLVDHLARTGRARRGVAISTATGSFVERVAAWHGLPVARHPIGFKHLSAALAAGEADVAGEESGGFALGAFARDKDGILAGCLLAELVASSGEPLGRRLRALERRLGSSACGSSAVPAGARGRDALARLREAPPERVQGAPVREVDARDGLRLRFDDGFLMLRASGTEGVLRVYAEAPGARGLARRLRQGRKWLGARVDERRRDGYP